MSDVSSNPLSAPTPAAQSAVCVAWSPVGVPIDSRLQSALKRPGLEVAVCDDPYAVLAVLTSAHLGGAGAKILLLVEPQRLPHLIDLLDLAPRYVPSLALWLFDPSRQPVLRSVRVGDVLSAIGAIPAPAPTLAPAAAPARTAPQPIPQRAPIAPARTDEPGPAAASWTGPWVASSTQKWNEPAAPAASLRLAGDGQLPARDDVAADELDAFADGAPAPQAETPQRKNPRVLTEEELAMLLGDEPPAHNNGGQSKGRPQGGTP